MHDCVKNHCGSSGNMKVIDLAEAFNEAPDNTPATIQNVADGDSSIADVIYSNVR